MIVVTLLAVIVLGLMAMFNQTQRAFRLGMAQTDVLAGGRLATDMISRELQEITPSQLNPANPNTWNFYSEVPSGPTYRPLEQVLLGSGLERTNVTEDLFFITRRNQTWTGIGYYVRTNSAYSGPRVMIGTLYRFETNNTARQFQNPPPGRDFRNALLGTTTNSTVSRILDGVVHFRVRVYDGNGMLITNSFARTNVIVNWSTKVPGEASYAFSGDAVPAFVEVELGILEPQAFERFLSIPNVGNAPERFLESQAGRVHLFRQRIPVRNVDPAAYQ